MKHTLKDLKACTNSPLSSIDRSSKQKFNKEILDLKHTIGLGKTQTRWALKYCGTPTDNPGPGQHSPWTDGPTPWEKRETE
jgi:hypothetical protein